MKNWIRATLTAAVFALSGPALAGQQTVTLSVPGMYCDACPAIVKGSLQKVAGVTQVKISVEKKTVVVTFDDGKVSVADLIKATTNAGYPSHQVATATQ